MRLSRRAREAAWSYLFLAPFLFTLDVFFLYAFLRTLYFSFTEYDLFAAPRWIGLENYRQLFGERLFLTALRNTMLYSVVVTLSQTVLALALAVALNQKLRGLTFFRSLYYMPSITSSVVITLIFMWLFQRGGAINYLTLHPVHGAPPLRHPFQPEGQPHRVAPQPHTSPAVAPQLGGRLPAGPARRGQRVVRKLPPGPHPHHGGDLPGAGGLPGADDPGGRPPPGAGSGGGGGADGPLRLGRGRRLTRGGHPAGRAGGWSGRHLPLQHHQRLGGCGGGPGAPGRHQAPRVRPPGQHPAAQPGGAAGAGPQLEQRDQRCDPLRLLQLPPGLH